MRRDEISFTKGRYQRPITRHIRLPARFRLARIHSLRREHGCRPTKSGHAQRISRRNSRRSSLSSLFARQGHFPLVGRLQSTNLEPSLETEETKTFFAVKGDESKAVGILKKGTSLAAIVDEVALIEKLGAQGLPTVKIHEVVEVEGRPAIVMDRYAQGSKDVVRLQNNKVRIVGDSTFLNEKSVADLQKIRDIMVKNNVKIDDLQFLIKSDGSVVIADPLNVVVGQGPSNVNLRTIELLISVAQKKR